MMSTKSSAISASLRCSHPPQLLSVRCHRGICGVVGISNINSLIYSKQIYQQQTLHSRPSSLCYSTNFGISPESCSSCSSAASCYSMPNKSSLTNRHKDSAAVSCLGASGAGLCSGRRGMASVGDVSSCADFSVIGFIGLGNMGLPIVRNLLSAGHNLIVHDVNNNAVDEAVRAGATKADNVKELAERATAVFSMLPALVHVKSVYMGPDGR
eukprot:GHVS01025180.1.p1 GENE.GHVS01025180.1~~GHVS01025180.1.p1  ORF type:complete len:212 (-),score=33.90 GHVS01025180.1:173-808(-)